MSIYPEEGQQKAVKASSIKVWNLTTYTPRTAKDCRAPKTLSVPYVRRFVTQLSNLPISANSYLIPYGHETALVWQIAGETDSRTPSTSLRWKIQNWEISMSDYKPFFLLEWGEDCIILHIILHLSKRVSKFCNILSDDILVILKCQSPCLYNSSTCGGS